jgi:hypothetical protein
MSLAVDFANLFLDDPILMQLWEGKVAWGDICGLDVERKRTRSVSVASSSSDEPDIMRICSHSRRVAFAEKPVISATEYDPVVPAYTPGIKTVITRNLPRNITVEQLRGVFEKYGPIKDIYIPKNMDKSSPYFGTTKGFALIKFLKPTDSARAYESEYSRLTIGKNNITVEFAKEDR